jgi:hypothetical protein
MKFLKRFFKNINLKYMTNSFDRALIFVVQNANPNRQDIQKRGEMHKGFFGNGIQFILRIGMKIA